jgi:hypothetical protein
MTFKAIPIGSSRQRMRTTGTPDTRAKRVKKRVITKADEMDRSKGWVNTVIGRDVTPPRFNNLPLSSSIVEADR